MKESFPIKKVVGNMTEEERTKVIERGQKIYDRQDYISPEIEREKTEKEIELIKLANESSNAILASYGRPPLDIPATHVHVIRADKWKGKDTNIGRYSMDRISIEIKERKNFTEFYAVVLHEMIHFKSYQAVQRPLAGKRDLAPYRTGLVTRTRDDYQSQLVALNEAVTELIVMDVLKDDVQKNQALREEYEQSKKLYEKSLLAFNSKGEYLFDKDVYQAEKVSRFRINTTWFTYEEERQALIFIAEHIAQNKDVSRDEVLHEFKSAVFTGNLLTIGKMIEETFGKGSFKEIGRFRKGKDLLAYLKFKMSLLSA